MLILTAAIGLIAFNFVIFICLRDEIRLMENDVKDSMKDMLQLHKTLLEHIKKT